MSRRVSVWEFHAVIFTTVGVFVSSLQHTPPTDVTACATMNYAGSL